MTEPIHSRVYTFYAAFSFVTDANKYAFPEQFSDAILSAQCVMGCLGFSDDLLEV